MDKDRLITPALPENILHYFKTFNMYIPDHKYQDKMLTQAKTPLLRVKSDPEVKP